MESKYYKLTDFQKSTYTLANQHLYIDPLKKDRAAQRTLELVPGVKYDLSFENRDQDELFIESLKEHTDRVIYSDDAIKRLQEIGYTEIQAPRFYGGVMDEKTYYITKPCGSCGGTKSKRWIVYRLVEVYE